MRKKGFEFSFAWLFAVVVGAIIIFFAIYFAIKLIGTKEYEISTITAKQLSIIFEPLEVGLASGKSSIAGLREETRIYNRCFSEGSFGKQKFSLARKGFGNKWTKEGGDISITNKYIFSNSSEDGRVIYFFSKPFEMPWKVSEIIFLSTNGYCFINAPEEIRDEVSGLNLQNIKIENCTDKEIKVCFGQGNCDIKVTGACLDYDCESEYDYGFVEKDKEKVFYTGSLIYAAIFSDKEIYECNIKRLISRLVQQALIYMDESSFLTGKCGSLPETSLLQIANIARSLKDSEDLILIKTAAENADRENEASECKLW